MMKTWLVDQLEYLWMHLYRDEIPVEKRMLVSEHLRGFAMLCPKTYLQEWIKELEEKVRQ